MAGIATTSAGHTITTFEMADLATHLRHQAGRAVAESNRLGHPVADAFDGADPPFTLRFVDCLANKVGPRPSLLDQVLSGEVNERSLCPRRHQTCRRSHQNPLRPQLRRRYVLDRRHPLIEFLNYLLHESSFNRRFATSGFPVSRV